MAKDDFDRKIEETYLNSDDASEVWVIVRGWTNFNRWLVDLAESSMGYNQRLLYLLAVAVLRRLTHLVTDGDWLQVIDVTEAYAEGEISPDQFYEACEAAYGLPSSKLRAIPGAAMDAVQFLEDDSKVIEGIEHVYDAAGYLAAIEAGELAADANLEVARSVWKSPGFLAGRAKEEKAICAVIHDIFGNPFRPVSFDLAWRTPNVVALADAIYQERELPSGLLDRTRLAILADALMDAGCDSADILAHCRSEGTHVRGCWVVDLILGKS